MKNFLIYFVLLLPFFAFSQDVITTKKGEDIQAKVLEITTSEVKYKKANLPDSPIYTLLKSDVLIIRYENGTKDIFSEEKNMASAQNTNYQPLVLNSRGNKIFQNGQRIKGEGIKSLLANDPDALRLYNQSERLKILAYTTGFASLGCSLWFFLDSVQALDDSVKGRGTNKELNWTPVIGTVVLMVPTTIFGLSAQNKKEEAINLYNLNQTRRVSIQPIIGLNSAGLVVKF